MTKQNSPWSDTQFVLASTLVIVLLVTLVVAVEGGLFGEFRFSKLGEEIITEAPSALVQPSTESEVSYVYANGQRIASVSEDGMKYYHSDYLGSSRMITDETGNKISSSDNYPFGSVLSESDEITKYKFTGKESDKTGLQYFGARYYDSNTGRFTQIDPIGTGYAYANNNPMKFVDPNGMEIKGGQLAFQEVWNSGYAYITPTYSDAPFYYFHEHVYAAAATAGGAILTGLSFASSAPDIALSRFMSESDREALYVSAAMVGVEYGPAMKLLGDAAKRSTMSKISSNIFSTYVNEIPGISEETQKMVFEQFRVRRLPPLSGKTPSNLAYYNDVPTEQLLREVVDLNQGLKKYESQVKFGQELLGETTLEQGLAADMLEETNIISFNRNLGMFLENAEDMVENLRPKYNERVEVLIGRGILPVPK
jgi:RHS repeat-associated protein